MDCFSINIKNKKVILSLGAESEGNFSIFNNKKIYFSSSFGDLLDEKNFQKFKKTVLSYLKKNKIKPDIILIDLHPLYKTAVWGEKLAQKFKVKLFQVQHHLAHIFSAIGDEIVHNPKFIIYNSFLGIACDGTGYGADGKIWGGEVFQIEKSKIKNQNDNLKIKIKRIGYLENQTMIGGDLAIKEPARMLISILNKFSIFNFQFSNKKEFIFHYVKKYYTKNQFELLYNQLQQNFNCYETSSTGRILDAVSILLGFSKNQRNYKHEPIDLLEKNSSKPYTDIRPKIETLKNNYILNTTFLFEYLIKNLHHDKKRLAATAQLYVAQGLYKIILKSKIQNLKSKIFFSGGIANNKIIYSYLESKAVYTNKKIAVGDAGLSFGQIIYYLLLTDSRN